MDSIPTHPIAILHIARMRLTRFASALDHKINNLSGFCIGLAPKKSGDWITVVMDFQ